jgi:orotate phosphoribosyltransferase
MRLWKKKARLFNRGFFRLSSGENSSFKIDCDALSDKDLEAIASVIAQTVDFFEVYGVPTGGRRLAEILRKYCSRHRVGREVVLIVDDVYNTGESIRKVKERLLQIRSAHETEEIVGFVIFSRHKPAPWVHSVFTLTTKIL